MQCFQCGTQFADGASNCPNCGMPVTNQFTGAQQTYQTGQTQGQPYMQGQPYGFPQPTSKKEFLKHPNLSKTRNTLITSAVVLYLCSVLSLVVGLIAGNYSIFIDVLLMVGLGLGIQLAQSRVCAVIITIYSIINVLYTIIATGTFGGYLIVIGAICALISTFQFQSAWKKYKSTGVLPMPK